MRGLTPTMNGHNTMREHILQKTHAMVGNTIEHDVTVCIEYFPKNTTYRFSTYVLNDNRPGIKKHVDNHISLADAIRASDDLVAERRSILTNKLGYSVWKQEKNKGDEEPAVLVKDRLSLDDARELVKSLRENYLTLNSWIANAEDIPLAYDLY